MSCVPNRETVIRRIISLYRGGTSGDLIAQQLNVSPAFVYQRLHAAGIAMRKGGMRPAFTATEGRAIAKRYRAGEHAYEIATSLRRSVGAVYNSLRQTGTHRRAKTESMRRLALNEGAFDVITEESAYWIGFLMADGCIVDGKDRGLSVCLAQKDRSHLERLRAFLRAGHTISSYRRKRPSVLHGRCIVDSEQVLLRVNSRRIVTALERYGLTPRKTRTASVRSLGDNRHFWRGVIDGDGTIGNNPAKPRVQLVGSEALVKQFLRFVYGCCDSRARARPVGSIWQTAIGGRHCATRLCEELYQGAAVSLARKQARVEAVLEYARMHPPTPPGPAPRVTNALCQRWKTAYLAGDGIERIAAAASFTPGTVSEHLRRSGIAMRPRGYPKGTPKPSSPNPSTIRGWQKARASGVRVEVIAAQAGVCCKTVYRYLHAA